MRRSSYKVPGGKLLKVKIGIEDDRISRIVITGDFFIHPESTLPEIEKNLLGCPLAKDKLVERIQSSLDAVDAHAIGFTSADLAQAILKAFEQDATK